MEFAADDMEMEDEIIELEDILEIPEEELGSADLDDAEGKDFASALARNANAVSSVPSAEEDLFPRIASLDDETVGVENELEHVMLSDEDMQPAGEFEGWTPEFDLMETVCEPKSGPCAGREMDTDDSMAFSEPPVVAGDTIPISGEEVCPGKQGAFIDNRDRVLDDLTKEMSGITEHGVPQLDFLMPEEQVSGVLKITGDLPGALPADQTTDAPPAGTSLVLDGLIAQLETKLIMNIQRLLEAKMPGIVASVIGEELENLKKHLRRIENRENDGP